MFSFGGETLSGAEITTVREITNCKTTDTGINLPFPMTGVSCISTEDLIFICGSGYAGHDKDCTAFDGENFKTVPSTKVPHHLSSMATFKGAPVILGGIVFQGGGKKYSDVVEILAGFE